MADTVVNGAGQVVDRGIEDLSNRLVPREVPPIPQHLPKFYLWTKTGPVAPQLVVGGERDRLYGKETFDIRSKYFNYSTAYANGANEEANSCMIQRIVAPDNTVKANVALWIDILETQVDDYQRLSDGSYALDSNGDKIVAGQISGFSVKFVATALTTSVALGGLTQQVGDQVDGATQSIRLPIAQFRHNFLGASGNDTGIRIWAPTLKTQSSMPTDMMNRDKVYPYYFGIFTREDSLALPKPFKTLFGETSIMGVFKDDVSNPLTRAPMSVAEIFMSSYQVLNDTRYADSYSEIGETYFYYNNIKTITEMFHDEEKAYINVNHGYDFTTDVSTAGLFNFITGETSAGVPYRSYVFVNASNSVTLSSTNTIYLRNGTDGTMSEANYNAAVIAELERYNDPNDELQDLAYHVESIIYDTGFPVDVKMAIPNFISKRKDTMIVMGTHTVGGNTLTPSEEYSLAIALRTRIRMFPESDFFGTEATRGIIFGCSGTIQNNEYRKRVPLTYEIMKKACKYMGAGDGKWKADSPMDGGDSESVVEHMTDISMTWVPVSVRNRYWDTGLNWVLRTNRRTQFIPHMKTVYGNDSSVLNSFETVMACCKLNKVAHAAWRAFCGKSKYTPAQLVSKVNGFVNVQVNGIFDNRFKIIPDAKVTEYDELTGFRWTLPIKIGANNMRTVMTTYTQAYRLADLDNV